MQVRILLVLADPTVLKRLPPVIARCGYGCDSAPSLAEAMDGLRHRQYPLAIVDLDLLGSDPAASAQQLRGANPRVRLVALDSLAERRTAEGAQSPFDAVLAKPFFLEPLLATLPGLLAT